jgi:hypothetical protein
MGENNLPDGTPFFSSFTKTQTNKKFDPERNSLGNRRMV